jgi:hypothetical protein
LASGNRTLELFPVHWEKYSGLLPGYTFVQSEPTRTVVNTTRHVKHKMSTVLADKTNFRAPNNMYFTKFPVPREIFSGRLSGSTLNNCFIT